jgi:putative ABC transport system permease protein
VTSDCIKEGGCKLFDYLKEIRCNLLSSFFVFFGFLIGMLSLSIGTSYFKNYYDFYNDKEIFSKHTNVATVSFNNNTTTFEMLFKIIPSISGSAKATSSDFTYSIGDKRIFVNGIYSTEAITKNDYPLEEGRYLTKEETASNSKIAMVGFLLKEDCQRKGDKFFINLEGDEYEVVGFIGRDSMSYWNGNIIVPLNALPKKYVSQVTPIVPLVFFNNNNENFINNFKQRFNNIIKDVNIKPVSNKVSIEQIINVQKSFYISMIVMLTISVLNILNFSGYWVESLKKSMAIRRVLGASSFDILKFIFIEILLIALIALVFSFIFHILLEGTIDKIFMMKIHFKYINLIFSFIFSILICSISTIYLLNKVLRFDTKIRNYI